jgi:hypothetical protein
LKKVIFIPGIMGSELFEGKEFKGRTPRWFSPKDKNILRLKVNGNNPDDINDEISPGTPLEFGFSFVGNWFKKNIVYARIMDELEELNSTEIKFLPYGYDWRKSIFQLCTDFQAFLDLNCKPEDELVIVAHSMGGLLIHTYCQIAKSKGCLPNISKVITLGTPWRGSAKSFITLMYGLEKGCFPKKELISEVGKTFPSVYQLLPHPSYSPGKSFIHIGDRELLWQDMMDYIQRSNGVPFNNVKLINLNLHNSLNNPWPDGIKHYNFIGHSKGTINDIFLVDYQMLPCDGDETVPLKSAIPLSAFKESIPLFTEATHEGLVVSKKVLKCIRSVILKDKVSFDGITSEYTPKTDWIVQRIACPVEVFVENEREKLDLPSDEISKHLIGDATFIIYNKPISKKVYVEPYDKGLTSIETLFIKDGAVESVEKFPSIEVDPSTRTIIETNIANSNDVKTKIYVSEQHEEKPLQGVLVKVPKHRRIYSPMTDCYLKSENKSKDNHFDYNGVIVGFNAEVPEPSVILETRYRLNQGEWHIFNNKAINLTTGKNGLVYGKNTLEFYSIDVYENKEKVRKCEFVIEPPIPKSKARVIMHPGTNAEVKLEPLYNEVANYKYEYFLNGQLQNYEGSITLKNEGNQRIKYRAEDIFETKSEWTYLNIDLIALQDKIWNVSGFNGNINELVETLPHPKETFIRCIIGDSPKQLVDKIRKNSKKVILEFEDVIYEIYLMTKLELYLDYHSEIIRKSDKNITISFVIQDEEGNSIEGIIPHVKYILMPVKDPDHDIKLPVVTNKKNKFTFNMPVSHLSNDVEKIRIEFRDFKEREKPIATRDFKIER